MNKTPNTLVQTSAADAYAELEERFDEWCELTGTDRNAVGAWETFEDQLPCD